MPLPSDEESKGGSYTEIDEIHGNQLQTREEEDETKTAIELVENTAKSFEEDVDKNNDKEGPGGFLGESETQSCGEDVVHDGININALYQELTLKKIWHERTWVEILKHFAITLIISVLPTFYDVGSDIKAVLEHGEEGNPIWSLTTLVLIFLPGLFFSIWIRKTVNIGCCCPESLSSITSCTCCMFYLFHPLSPIGYLLFPFILIAVKIMGLFIPGREWKRLTMKVTSFEGDFESSLQTLLTLYIVLVRGSNGQLPYWWQYPQLTASMVMITKTAIADYLLPRQPMSLKEELKSTIILIPLFLSNCVFKVLSFATIAAMLWFLALIIFPVAIVLLHLPNILACCCCLRIGYLTLGSPKHMVKLLVIRNGGRTTKQSMKNFLYNNIFWFIFYVIMLSLLLKGTPEDYKDTPEQLPELQVRLRVIQTQLRGILEELDVGGVDLGGTELPKEIFHVLCGVILSALVLNIVLIYFQLWRPFKAEQQARNEDIECDAEIVEEGSHTALLAPIGTILCLVLSAIVSTMIYFYFYYKQPSLEDINFN